MTEELKKETLAQKKMSRADFLKGMGKSVAGITLVGGVSTLLAGCTNDAAAPAETPNTSVEGSPDWPFEYVAVDIAAAQERGYNAYKTQGGWGIGVAEGLFGTMAEEVGYPYNQIPTASYINASGGYQSQSLCGALGVAAAFIGTVAEKDTSKKVVGELISWYKQAELPMYQPEEPELPTTVASSSLCYDSVSNYMSESGYSYGDPERKQRCAGVTADVVRKTLELLNENL